MGGVQVGWVRVRNGEVSAQSIGGGRWGKTSVQTVYNLFLQKLIEGAVMTDARSLFQYFTTLTKMPPPPSAVAHTLEYLVGAPS